MFINLNYTLQNNIFLALFVGQSLVKLHEVDSTNDYLKNLLSNSKPLIEGTVIMAEYQTAGRGQKGNVWKSEKGANLTFSILLRPSFFNVNQQFQFNKAVSLGISDVLIEILGKEAKIKWPNDVYFNNQKLGGILIENTIKGNFLKESIVGIGLNANKNQLLDKDYLRRLFRLDESHQFEIAHQNFEGVIKGVTPSGRLSMQLSNGEQMDLDLKEVKFIFD